MKKLCRVLGSFFYLGALPAGGTWGSAAGWTIAWIFPAKGFLLLLPFCAMGYALTLVAEESFGSRDPGAFVWDEVCGMMLSVLWLPKNLTVCAAAFALFRVLDIWKPWPISMLQKMKHPFSIMHDDLAAGFASRLELALGRDSRVPDAQIPG